MIFGISEHIPENKLDDCQASFLTLLGTYSGLSSSYFGIVKQFVLDLTFFQFLFKCTLFFNYYKCLIDFVNLSIHTAFWCGLLSRCTIPLNLLLECRTIDIVLLLFFLLPCSCVTLRILFMDSKTAFHGHFQIIKQITSIEK